MNTSKICPLTIQMAPLVKEPQPEKAIIKGLSMKVTVPYNFMHRYYPKVVYLRDWGGANLSSRG